jgi:hypothetical protein
LPKQPIKKSVQSICVLFETEAKQNARRPSQYGNANPSNIQSAQAARKQKAKRINAKERKMTDLDYEKQMSRMSYCRLQGKENSNQNSKRSARNLNKMFILKKSEPQYVKPYTEYKETAKDRTKLQTTTEQKMKQNKENDAPIDFKMKMRMKKIPFRFRGIEFIITQPFISWWLFFI